MVILLALAVLAIGALSVAGRNWISLWQGFDQLAMSVDTVDLDQDEREIVVTSTFVNESDQRLQIHVLDTGLRLSGRSVTAGSERYNDLILEPDNQIELQTAQRVHGQDAEMLQDEIETDGGVWNVSGRVQVSVDGLSDPLWLPFQYEIEAQP